MAAPHTGLLVSTAERGAFHFSPPPAPSPYCAYAEEFAAWATVLYGNAVADGRLVALNQAQLALVHRYFLWRDNVPKRHQTLSGGRVGHTCLFAVFEAFYRQLREAELRLEPPPLAVAPDRPPRPPAPTSALDGIILGMLDPDPEFG